MRDSDLLKIVKYPEPVLRKKAVPVARITPEMGGFLDRMVATMDDAHGAGLAAPQVGVSLRIITVDVEDKLYVLINPEITSASGEQTGPEGCLSLPNLYGDVTRAQHVVVRALNARGKKITLNADDFLARALQHEIDHLDGVLLIDRVDPTTLEWLTDKTDEEGNRIMRPTTLEEALRVFESQAAVKA